MAVIAPDRLLERALAAIDPEALARDAAALVQASSLTGDERPAFERLAELAGARGLEVDLQTHDLAALRAHAEHPGEEAPRSELLGLTATLTGGRPERICLNGHLDVVEPGTVPWRHGPWSGRIEDGWLHGRGAVDMKGGVVAALHALAALRAAGRASAVPTAVLQAVGSEEDGGLGTFAALERDGAWDACLIPEPTELDVVCAQAGALTFRGTIRGRSTHAAVRLAGRSAIDRYLPVHVALAEHERRLNTDVASSVMRTLPLPYPVCVGRVASGAWSSSVPDRLEFEGRVGVRVGESVAEARAGLEAAVREAQDGEGPDIEIAWSGGSFASAETPREHPWVRRVVAAVRAERGSSPALVGVPWGADMRHFTNRGIPCTMVGPSGSSSPTRSTSASGWTSSSSWRGRSCGCCWPGGDRRNASRRVSSTVQHPLCRYYASPAPTARPRHTLTETDALSRALDDAAQRWPADRDARARLLLRLVEEGHRAIRALGLLVATRRPSADARRYARRAAR